MQPLLIDGDIYCYRAAYATEKTSSAAACRALDNILGTIFAATRQYHYIAWLTGDTNFRTAIAVTAGYKATRTKVKPQHLHAVQAHARERWHFRTTIDEEADDAIGIAQTFFKHEGIVVSDDKDLLQIAGIHYRPNRDDFLTITPWEGLVHFYTQMLTGDASDNIRGLWKVGPAAAQTILQGCTTEVDLYRATLRAYNDNAIRVLENGQLLWIRREAHQLWRPPTEREVLCQTDSPSSTSTNPPPSVSANQLRPG